MLQSILQHNSLRSTGSSNRAQIKELTEDGQCVDVVIKLMKPTYMHMQC